jgi:hypothetical protein
MLFQFEMVRLAADFKSVLVLRAEWLVSKFGVPS